jgi:two-component system, cell cycle sensor histidine kinase and response regulator CckA
MTTFRTMSIRSQIISLIILMTLLPMTVIVYNAFKQERHDIDEAVDIADSIAKQVQNDQQFMLAAAEQLAATVSVLPAVKQRDTAAVNSLLAELVEVNPQISNIIIADRTGALWASAVPATRGVSCADRRFFRNTLLSGKTSSGEYTEGKVPQAPLLSIGYPIKDRSGAVSDVMAIVFSLNRYSQLHSGYKDIPVSSILLIDHKGTILYSTADSRLIGTQDRSDYFRRMSSGPNEGRFEDDGDLGIRSIFSYRKLWLSGESSPFMYVRTGLNKEYIQATARQCLMVGVGTLVPAMLVMLGMAFWFCKRNLLNRITALQKTTQKIAQGDLAARVSDRISGGELGELGDALNEMAHRLQLADEAQRRSEEKYRELVDNVGSIIMKVDTEGRVTFFNEYAQRFFGFSEAEIVGRSVIGTIVPENGSSGRNLVEIVQNTCVSPDEHTHIINENIRKNGERVWISWDNHALVNADGSKAGILSVGQNITERTQYEEILRQSEEKFSAIFQASPDAIILSRLHDEMILDVNESFTRITGFTAEEVVGKTSVEIGLWDDINDRAKLELVIGRHGEIKNFESYLRSRDGSRLLAQLSANTIQLGDISCLLIIMRDITEREYILSERLKTQKLESISVLASGVAHNFNNVLTGIIGYISYARKHLEERDKVSQILESAEKSSYRAVGLARQLLAFSRSGNTAYEAVPVDTLIEESVSLFLSGSNVNGTIACSSQQRINADSLEINQVFNNIVLNALHAMPDGGTLAVRVDSINLDDSNMYSLQPGAYVKIVFEDSGCGIAKEDLDKVFDPYFSTKDTGTGLGLSSTHSIITKHGGHIDIASEVGKGTSVSILLPSAKEEQVNDLDLPEQTGHHQKGVSILVMDDEELIRDLADELLTNLGFKVTTCANGEEACARYREVRAAGKRYATVILDLTVNDGMGGIEAARRILDLDPHACLIASSGYAHDPAIEEYKPFGFCGSIAKPYSTDELARTVHKALKVCRS